jgi:hypothetical protein
MSTAISFKTLTSDDRTTSRTLLHESIPITGTLISGTYATASGTDRGLNIKTFSHGMFQSVYDYPYASSSANHIFDITCGFSAQTSSNSAVDGPGPNPISSSAAAVVGSQVAKKVNIYNQMAQVLVGYDTASNVRRFDVDGNFSTTTDKADNAFFLNFSRLLVKDEIKKGSFRLNLGTGSAYTIPFNEISYITDVHATGNYHVNSPAGEYGTLKDHHGNNVGLIYYQAGIAVLTSSALGVTSSLNAAGHHHADLLSSGNMDAMANAVRHRISNISFNNTTELNSTLYFCRAGFNEFNYSSNPTYLTGSKIRVKQAGGNRSAELLNMPVSYVTTVGLYSPDNELLAVAKLSEPLKKTPINELTLRVRLDY